MSFPSLVQQSLGDRVAQELRVRIIGGELARGTRLVEDVLAEQFDVSRGPIRDAFRQLEAEGLLESRRRGVFVIGLTEDDVDELYTLRGSLETLALSLAMRRAAPEDWARAEECSRAMESAAQRRDASAFARADLEFHAQLYQLSGHRRLLAVWEQYRPTFGVMLDVTNAQDIDLHPAAEAHAELLRLARTGDEEGAVTNLRGHLLGAQNRLRSALRATQSSAAED
ncbi:GntR family transcriptional regulator [Saccharopolyspora hirsuta]|uniref:GntR family transcriptional regulator n=1 Tax=Saccharopolyspora hirsuta TaxID=1837 RepID=A0A5M7BRC5_SACHI|nr:GntR family transcriptional regulator [Saccharopolyspora hirsuta]KAA5831923.1 GntR family transcriptional regulator [Saccharopolyspora hirsuta]